MKHPKQFYKNLDIGNGYKWSYFTEKEKGIKTKNVHCFTRFTRGLGYKSIYLIDEDIETGNAIDLAKVDYSRA